MNWEAQPPTHQPSPARWWRWGLVAGVLHVSVAATLWWLAQASHNDSNIDPNDHARLVWVSNVAPQPPKVVGTIASVPVEPSPSTSTAPASLARSLRPSPKPLQQPAPPASPASPTIGIALQAQQLQPPLQSEQSDQPPTQQAPASVSHTPLTATAQEPLPTPDPQRLAESNIYSATAQVLPARPAHSNAQTAPVDEAPEYSTAVTPPTSRLPQPLDAQSPPPPYPLLSRRLGEQGEVVLRVQVSPNGEPLHIELAKPSGFPRLDRAALQAVANWRFLPGLDDGQATAAWVEVPVRFDLN